MLAIQGPAVYQLKNLEGVSHLPCFGHTWTKIGGLNVFVSRTGYTGEDGLEAGMLPYGQDIDTSTNPFEAGLGWLVDLDKGDFIGRTSLLSTRRRGVRRKLIGFQMDGRKIARSSHRIFKFGEEVGRVTSGGYAPTLGFNIGLGYVPIELATICSPVI